MMRPRRTLAVLFLLAFLAVPSQVSAQECSNQEVAESMVWFAIAIGNSLACIAGSPVNCWMAGAMMVEGYFAERCADYR